MKQNYTSAETSINTLNRVYVKHLPSYPAGCTVLDYGCGKFDTNKEYAESLGLIWYGFDPYNRSEAENAISREIEPDVVVCSNVLNVIDSDEAVEAVIADIKRRLVPCYYTIYEGNGSGVGKATSKGYQRNAKAASYIPMLRKYYSTIIKRGNILICS